MTKTPRRQDARNIRILFALAMLGLAVAGCGGPSPSNPVGTAVSVADATPTEDGTPLPLATPIPGPSDFGPIDKAHPQKVTIALGFNPDIQFTPFYVALNKGYYSDEGLDVTFKHGIVPDLIKLLGEGNQGIDLAVASGDEIIPARLQGIPVVYVMTWYRQYPVAAASIIGKGPTLKSPADLKSKTVGVPGPYGSTYTGLLALLKAGNLTLNDIKLKSIGFTQVESLAKGQVDVAMVYAANEPVQLRAQGLQVSTLMVADYINLASNGLVTTKNNLQFQSVMIARVVHATQRGIQDTMTDPASAFQQALKQVPQAGGANQAQQLQVLQETVKLMQVHPGDAGAGFPIGRTDADLWARTEQFLYDAKIISVKGYVSTVFTNRFIPESRH